MWRVTAFWVLILHCYFEICVVLQTLFLWGLQGVKKDRLYVQKNNACDSYWNVVIFTRESRHNTEGIVGTLIVHGAWIIMLTIIQHVINIIWKSWKIQLSTNGFGKEEKNQSNAESMGSYPFIYIQSKGGFCTEGKIKYHTKLRYGCQLWVGKYLWLFFF